MALGELTNTEAVRRAVEEFEALGRARFLAKYGFRPARTYFLTIDGKHYDSKAIVGAAHGFQFGSPLRPVDFSGGEFTVARKLRSLGYNVVARRQDKELAAPVPAASESPEASTIVKEATAAHATLNTGQTYSWEVLGERFGFNPDYLGAAGGMISRPTHNTLLLMSHPEGAKSFDYGDYWDNGDLIYAGRGKIGDQKLEGQNRDLTTNRRVILVFEPAGARQVRLLGQAHCVEHWWTREPDQKEKLRRVLRCRLRFESGARLSAGATEPRYRRPTQRKPRRFDPAAPPPAPPRPGQPGSTPEERAQLLEQATSGHHTLVKALALHLEKAGWEQIEEVPGGLDLRARKGQRCVIFEAKTLRNANATHQVRLAIAQLLEYRFIYGQANDGLCLVADAPISEQRVGLLDALSIGVLIRNADGLRAAGSVAASIGLGG
jgi:hypothetical protein